MADIWGEIGSIAGKVYTEVAKSKKGADLTDIKKALKADETQLLMAVGWLAREDKIAVDKTKSKVTLTLKG
jgi:hypothetical protein